MDKYSHIKIADRIMQKAREAGFRSERALCREAGVNANFVRAVRIGKTRSPRGDNLQKIASTLKVSVDWILTGHEESSPVTTDMSAPHGATAGQQIAARALQRGRELGYKSERAICLAAGVSVDFLRHLRIGKNKNARTDNLAKIADFLGVSMEWLVTKDQESVAVVGTATDDAGILFGETCQSDEIKCYQRLSMRLASVEKAISEIVSQGNFHVTALAASAQIDNDLDICRKNMISAMRSAGLNPNRWAKMAGVSEGGVRGFLNGDAPNISLGYLSRLAAVLGFGAADFLRSDGIQNDWNRPDPLLDK